MRFLVFLAILGTSVSAGVRIVHALNPPKPLDTGGQLVLPAGPVVINEWASWCGACQAEAATIADFERAHPDVPIVGIDDEQSSAAGSRAAEVWGWHHSSVLDPTFALGTKLKMNGIPTTIFLDAHHHEVDRIPGAASRALLEAGLREAT